MDFTYRQDGEHSWFRDRILTATGRDWSPGAIQRLERHDMEMRGVMGDRNSAAFRAMRAAGFEYRVDPNTNAGTGGNFAPPLWANELFATSKRAGRPLADVIPGSFPMPPGVSSINLPIINQGSVVQPVQDGAAVAEQDITDQAGSSTVVTLAGQVDVALQLLEQSPPTAALDWAFLMDLAEAYDTQLEQQLLYGAGTVANQILGVANAATAYVSYNDSSPTGSEMWPLFGQTVAQVGDNRDRPPEIWLMRTARWAWLNSSEDTATRPFGLPSPFFMGASADTPDPVGGLLGFPVFLDDAIPATMVWGSPSATVDPGYVGGTQDMVIAVRPSDLIFFEGNPQISVGNVYYEPGSGSLTVKIGLHDYAAMITRYTAGAVPLGGTGFAVQSGY